MKLSGWQKPNKRSRWHYWPLGAGKSACRLWWLDVEVMLRKVPDGPMCTRCWLIAARYEAAIGDAASEHAWRLVLEAAIEREAATIGAE